MGKNTQGVKKMIASILHFLTMGGYALYVWPAYGVSFFVLAMMIYLPLKKRKKRL